MEINNELNDFLYQFESISEKTSLIDDSFYEELNSFKLKYIYFHPFKKQNFSNQLENKLISILNNIKKNSLGINCLEFLELFWKCYKVSSFKFQLNITDNPVLMFINTGRGEVISELNSLIDELICFIFENNTIKEIIIHLNILVHSHIDSLLLDIKLIFLYIICLEKTNSDARYYDIILSKIYFLLEKMFKIITQKYRNDKSDIYIFLEKHLMNLIIYIITNVRNIEEKFIQDLNEFNISENLSQILIDFSEKNVKRKIFSDNILSKSNNSIVYVQFLLEILQLIIKIYDSSKDSPLSLEKLPELDQSIISELIYFVRSNIFFYASFYKSQLLHIKEKDSLDDNDNFFSIYKHMNKVGLSYFYYSIYMNDTNISFIPQVYNKNYIMDIYLLFISILIKNGEYSFFLGFDVLFKLILIFKDKEITNLTDFKYYSYVDLFIEIVENIGLPYNEKKKHFIVINIESCLKILSDSQKKILFAKCLKRRTKNEGENAFVIYILKNLIKKEFYIPSANNLSIELFDSSFLVDIIFYILNPDLTLNYLEDITQCLNFAYFLINLEHKLGEKKFQIFSPEIINKFNSFSSYFNYLYPY